MIIGWVRTLLLHAAIHWPMVADLKLCPFALQHEVTFGIFFQINIQNYCL